MKATSLLRCLAGEPKSSHPLSTLILLALSLAASTNAIIFNSIPSANLDLSQLGRVGLLGDFEGISLYEYEGQTEDGYNTNGSQSVMARLPNGAFASLATADAGIRSMCSFSPDNGAMEGVIIGGNFTSLGGVESPGVAMFNPNTSAVSSLLGISGQVMAVLCDNETNSVYVGGNFVGSNSGNANSSNAMAWNARTGWTNLPFLGFNGQVNAISKAPNGNVIFGGSFSGLGTSGNQTATLDVPDQQVINIAGASLTSSASTRTTGFSNASNIVCKTSDLDGARSTWLLEDDINGSWTATFGFTFTPTKLRLWNTHQDGRGTKTWRYTAMPINGIMNFTYTDPVTQKNESCTSECPLSNNSSLTYQDFYFVNNVLMDAFRIDISAWYGAGGGLDGIELFEDDIFVYAIDSFNEPTCADISLPSTSTQTGSWSATPSGTSDSDYLTATLTEADVATSSVVFFPDIKQSGNYSVNMYTPGCLQDNTCTSRGQVNVTGIMGTGDKAASFKTTLYQTNNYEKYDQIYFGYVEAGTGAFRPSITLAALPNQGNNLTVVAQRVGFTLVNNSGGLKGLYEYNPSETTTDENFTDSVFDMAGDNLTAGADITVLEVLGDTTYVGGTFNTTKYANILAVGDSASALTAGGLNGAVLAIASSNTTLFVGGTFSNTFSSQTSGLNNIAAYETSSKTWSALGAGVNGAVFDVVPMMMNVTSNAPETVITLTGSFNEILASDSNSSISVSGFAIWVPSQANWLQNLDASTAFIDGKLSAAIETSAGTLFAGTLDSQQLLANGAAELTSNLGKFPIQLEASTSSGTINGTSGSQNISGIATALFYDSGTTNITVLGGHFAARASNGSTVNNLAFIDNTATDVVAGIGSQISNDSTFLAAAMDNSILYAGGQVTGTVNGDVVAGIISYNLKTNDFTSMQPPALSGSSSTVNAITVRPDTSDVYVGGGFTSAGSLPCPGVCLFSSSTSQWNRPGTGLSGTANTMLWSNAKTLIVGGTLTLNGGRVPLAMYDTKASTWTAFNGAASIPGAVTSLVAANADNSQLWVAATATNGSNFIMKYDGSSWNPIDVLGTGSIVRGLQVFTLTANHDSSSLVPQNQALLVTGSLNVPGFGRASSATFNGTALKPFVLSTKSSNSPGSISHVIVEKENFFTTSNGKLALGFIVLIALAIALALTFLLVVGGIIAHRIRRKREGYVPAPTNSFDKGANLDRVPPERLFGAMAESRNPPMI